MATDQYRLHPAVHIFLDHLLSDVEDENENLQESNKLLESACDFLTKVELHLRGGFVMSTAMTRSFVMDGHDDYRCGIGIPIDADENNPRPLLDFSGCDFRMMGQTVGTLSGLVTILDIRADGTIHLRIHLSGQCALEGVLRNLSVEDFACFSDRVYSSRHITMYLMTGVGLQHAASVTFTPVIFLLEISPMLQRTLKLVGLLPSLDSVKNDLVCHFAGVGDVTKRSRLLCAISRNGWKNERTLSLQSEKLLLSTVAAVGHGQTDEILVLLAKNQLLKYNHCGLCQIQKMIGMVEITHPGFNVKVSLKDGKLHDNDGYPVWRILLPEEATPASKSRHSLMKIKLYLAGMPLPLTNISYGFSPNRIDLDWFEATSDNGTKIYCRPYLYEFYFVNAILDIPLSSVRSILGVLGVDV
ncbi:hypothetical protein ACHAW5_001323 [Stephanodiscus triporus]|uniref:Uncharacterized protein n=1 Tax=Stephanodiscus triporus TaxID=2934178 RepID=A0ABD3Q236_9STRA